MSKQDMIDQGMALDIEFPDEPVVAEDDWELGPACGLDPEVCESCQ